MSFRRMGGRRQSPRRQMLAPIVTFRQIGDKSISLIGGAIDDTTLATGSDSQDVGSVNTVVRTGTKIYRIRVVINCRGASSAVSGDIGWYLAKVRNAQAFGSFPSPVAMGGDPLRNQIFHSQYDSYGTEDGYRYKFDRWIKIPKIYQRMRSGDFFIVKLLNQSSDALNYTIHYDYKAYS